MKKLNQVECVELQKSDYSKLSDLHEKYYSVSREDQFWKWKYDERPGGADVNIAVAKTDDGAIVGQVGALNFNCMVDGQPCQASQLQDIVILKEYRGGKTFFKLEKMMHEMSRTRGVAFNYAFTIEITRKISLRVGFKDLGGINKMVRVVNPVPYLKAKLPVPVLPNIIGALLRPLLSLKYKQPTLPELSHDVRIDQVDEFDERFDTLWAKECGQHRVIVDRSAEALNWRYASNPAQSYQTFVLLRGDDLLGYIVLEIKEGFRGFETLAIEVNNARRGEVLDYLVRSDDDLSGDDILNYLIRAAQDYFIRERVDVISAWCLPHMRLYPTLASLGYKLRATPHHLIVRGFVSDHECANDINNWYVTHGDKDHF